MLTQLLYNNIEKLSTTTLFVIGFLLLFTYY